MVTNSGGICALSFLFLHKMPMIFVFYTLYFSEVEQKKCKLKRILFYNKSLTYVENFQCLPKKIIHKKKQIAELGRQTRENIAIDAFIVNSEDCSGTSEEIIISGKHDYYDTNTNLPSTEISVGEVDTLDVIDQNQNTKSRLTAKKSTGPGIARNRQNKSVVLRKNYMEYLKNKNEKKEEIKLRELQSQEQKLKLVERNIEIGEYGD
nr:uncharacterized protein LOC111510541 [Leptinotarsa decemlineata]